MFQWKELKLFTSICGGNHYTVFNTGRVVLNGDNDNALGFYTIDAEVAIALLQCIRKSKWHRYLYWDVDAIELKILNC
ncbi:hypothetical protein C9J27_05945 [Photobacterium kishitanii]|uniref:Uncharacterized protein n=1 Tax=Photobacterium kishitanii TaxID=318456 RepID=A0A2T3KM10_9GAMM|nr:hypothetical protein C9J27_05945 [Photobacterium kishitanii]